MPSCSQGWGLPPSPCASAGASAASLATCTELVWAATASFSSDLDHDGIGPNQHRPAGDAPVPTDPSRIGLYRSGPSARSELSLPLRGFGFIFKPPPLRELGSVPSFIHFLLFILLTGILPPLRSRGLLAAAPLRWHLCGPSVSGDHLHSG